MGLGFSNSERSAAPLSSLCPGFRNAEITLEVRLQRRTATKSSNVQRRVRDSSGGSEGSGILVDIRTEGNTWLGGTVLILRRCTGLVAENGAE